MTREEAITQIKVICKEYIKQRERYRDSIIVNTFLEALNMAIDALEQEPTDDATLKDIFCTGCEYKEQEPCDAISREAAIKAECDVCAIGGGYDKCQYFMQGCNEIECIRVLPSVQPSRKGHWIEKEDFNGDTYYDCSECGESFCLMEGTPTDNLYNYCPNCGADMRESEVSE